MTDRTGTYVQNKPGTAAGVDMNRDPITGAPGSHPVGSGTGAAIGATVGGVVGAVGGPVGVVAGAAIGGLAGGLVGKSAAEVVNPTGEMEYWKIEFPNRPYARGYAFNDYEPAYLATATAYNANVGRTFEEVESDLERTWTAVRRDSRVEWRDARLASKDAWDRIATNREGRVPEREHDSGEAANDLLEFLYDGSKGFEQAAGNVKNAHFKSELLKYSQQRSKFVEELKPMIALRGGKPATGGTAMGAIHRGWIGLKSAITSGDKAILAECERGEDAAVAKYRKVLDRSDITPQVRTTLQRQAGEVQHAHNAVKAMRDSVIE